MDINGVPSQGVGAWSDTAPRFQMKNSIIVFALLLLMLLSGCSTQSSVARLEGRGTSQVFDAGYDPVWHAAEAAVQMNDLRILDTDKASGYISARRSIGVTTFGENVAVWVREVNPQQAQVEVVSRPVGPPVSPAHSEERVLRTIAAILPSAEPSVILNWTSPEIMPSPGNPVELNSHSARFQEISSEPPR
jgi:hypothetical protein